MVLCDTNIAIYILNGNELAIRRVEEIGEVHVAYSIVSFVEAVTVRDTAKAREAKEFLKGLNCFR